MSSQFRYRFWARVLTAVAVVTFVLTLLALAMDINPVVYSNWGMTASDVTAIMSFGSIALARAFFRLDKVDGSSTERRERIIALAAFEIVAVAGLLMIARATGSQWVSLLVMPVIAISVLLPE